MTAKLESWIITVSGIYVMLVAAYWVTCCAVLRLNRRLAGAKIQPREAPSLQITRDRSQSIRSLAVIAVLFGTGHWFYAELGWGLAPLRGPAGMLLSLVASLVLFDTW